MTADEFFDLIPPIPALLDDDGCTCVPGADDVDDYAMTIIGSPADPECPLHGVW